MYLVHKRAEVIAHLVNTNSQYNLPPFGKKLIYAKNRQALNIPARFADPSIRQSVTADVRLVDCLDELIGDVELYLDRTVKVDDADTFYRLRSISGVGKILALVLLYEMHAYATGPDLNALIARARGDPARLDHDDGYACLLTNCWLPVRRAKSTNYADRRGFARIRS